MHCQKCFDVKKTIDDVTWLYIVTTINQYQTDLQILTNNFNQYFKLDCLREHKWKWKINVSLNSWRSGNDNSRFLHTLLRIIFYPFLWNFPSTRKLENCKEQWVGWVWTGGRYICWRDIWCCTDPLRRKNRKTIVEIILISLYILINDVEKLNLGSYKPFHKNYLSNEVFNK